MSDFDFDDMNVKNDYLDVKQASTENKLNACHLVDEELNHIIENVEKLDDRGIKDISDDIIHREELRQIATNLRRVSFLLDDVIGHEEKEDFDEIVSGVIMAKESRMA
jgi:hypothetical protein